MNDNLSLRRKYWILTFAWVGCIYSTLYVVRPICDFLQERTPFTLVVNTSLILILGLLMIILWRKKRFQRISSYVLLGFVLLCYGYGIKTLRLPAEKIHFVQYGLLAFLCFQAIRVDLGKPWAFGAALLLAFILGWIDEGIQHLLPNRYYEFRDVLLNGWSATLGLLFTYIFQREMEQG